jgi:hypothetical protein
MSMNMQNLTMWMESGIAMANQAWSKVLMASDYIQENSPLWMESGIAMAKQAWSKLLMESSIVMANQAWRKVLMESGITMANQAWSKLLTTSDYIQENSPVWANYLQEEMTDAVDRLQRSPLFWGILVVWMAVGVINMVRLLAHLLFGEVKSQRTYSTAKPSWEHPHRPTTRSMTRSTQYENARTPAARARRRALIFQPLP